MIVILFVFFFSGCFFWMMVFEEFWDKMGGFLILFKLFVCFCFFICFKVWLFFDFVGVKFLGMILFLFLVGCFLYIKMDFLLFFFIKGLFLLLVFIFVNWLFFDVFFVEFLKFRFFKNLIFKFEFLFLFVLKVVLLILLFWLIGFCVSIIRFFKDILDIFIGV